MIGDELTYDRSNWQALVSVLLDVRVALPESEVQEV
jgi:hypothetical protein